MSERKHRHIVETGLTLLSTASVPKSLWHYAFATAVYLINRMPTPVLHNQSPYQKLFQTDPNYAKLKVFGCLCFPWLRPYTHHKLDDRSQPCVFVGYSTSQSAYYCLHRPTGRVFTSRHVNFVEDQFPYSGPQPVPHIIPETTQATTSSPPHQVIPVTAPCSILHQPPAAPPPAPPQTTNPQVCTPSLSTPSSPSHSSHSGPSVQHNNGLNSQAQSPAQQNQATIQTLNPTQMAQEATTQPPTQPTPPNTNPTSSSSQTQQTTSAQNTENQPQPVPPITSQNQHPMQTRGKNRISKPNQKFTLLATTSKPLTSEPTTIIQALKDEQ